MAAPIRFIFQGQTLWLSAERCIFWEEERALILSDLHFGKSGHFRKSGIGIPQNIFKQDLQRLFAQMQFFKPKRLLITGDMFHSKENKEADFFVKWRMDFPSTEFYLVRGNHDILSASFYQKANITLFENRLIIKDFCFTHDANSCNGEAFIFSGHIHPGVKMSGTANQSVVLPCFYFGKKYAVLPAFSAFTGLAKIRPSREDHVFVLFENSVLKIQ